MSPARSIRVRASSSIGVPGRVEAGQRVGGAPQQPATFGHQHVGDHLALGRGDHVLQGRVPAGLLPGVLQGGGDGRVDQGVGDHLGGVVPGGAVAGPVRQRLVALEDLLDPDRGARPQGGAQPHEVALRVGEAVGVVDAVALDDPALVEVDQHPVGGVEDVRQLDAHGDQAVHVEEPAVVEHVVALAPAGQDVVLLREHRGHLGARVAVPGAGRDREDVVVVPQHLAAVLLTEAQVALGEDVGERLPQHRQADPAVEGRPVHV